MKKCDKEVYQKTLDLFNYQCAICGNTNIHLHHIRYGACGRKTYLGNVIPLCKRHHDLVHTNKKEWQPKLIEIIERVINEENNNSDTSNNIIDTYKYLCSK